MAARSASIWKVLEKHEAIRQKVMGGAIPGWWCRAKRDTEEEGNKGKAAGQESEWCRHLKKRAAAEELRAALEGAQDEADREARRESEWLTKWLRKKIREEVP